MMGYLLSQCGIKSNSFTKKITKMKKVFALIAIVGFVACNNASDAVKNADSTAAATVDSTKAAANATVDSTKKAGAAMVDSTKAKH